MTEVQEGELALLILTIVLATATALLLFRMLMLRREIGRMAEQLQRYNNGETGKKMDIALFDSKLEKLAGQINAQSRRINEAEAQQNRIRQEFRQAAVNMSHDIRTPLTSIRGFIQLLDRDAISSEERKEYVEIVNNRTSRLQSLLDDFFELAVIESPEDDLNVERLDMTSLIADMAVSYYDGFNKRGIVPAIVLPNQKIMAYGEESAVRRVVENLLANTLKYGSGTVEIILERGEEDVSFTIVNEAKELAGSDVNLLFDRFYTADRARSAQTSGLGLAIAKSLMVKMGGKLEAVMDGNRLKMRCRWKPAPDHSI
jgi:signal transduction histidine kinase